MKNSSLTIFIFQLWIVQLRQKLLIIIQERGIQEIVRESRGNLFWNVSWIYYENKHGIHIFYKRNTIVSKRLYPRIYVSFSPTTILRIIESNRIVTIPERKIEFYNHKLDKNTETTKAANNRNVSVNRATAHYSSGLDSTGCGAQA